MDNPIMPPAPLVDNASSAALANKGSFERDYGYAILHIATLRLNETDRFILLFARLELVPMEISQMMGTAKWQSQRFPKSKDRAERIAFVQRIRMSIPEAIEWYVNCLEGKCSLPKNEYNDYSIAPEIFNLHAEPPWPLMTCVDDDSFIPFTATWHIYPRLHQLVSLSFSPDAMLADGILDEQQIGELSRFLSGLLHFDFAEYPSLWGSVNLLAPNPIFREFNHQLREANDPNGDTIEFSFVPRKGRKLDGLTIIIEEPRSNGHGVYVKSVTSDKGEMYIPYQLGQNRVKVVHNEYGLLFAQGLARFIRGISVTTSLDKIGVAIETSDPSTRNEPSASPSVEQAMGATALPQISTSKYLSAEAKLTEEKHRQEQRREERRKQQYEQNPIEPQKHFYNDYIGALKEVRLRASRATERLLIVDAYFSHSQLDIIKDLHKDNPKLRIQILSSAYILKNTHNPAETLPPEQEAQQAGLPILGRQLFHSLAELQSQDVVSDVEIKVLEGEKPPIHDRFLCIDNAVHILGNSINGIGKISYSVIALAPKPEEIFQMLNDFWRQAVSLEKWLEKRKLEK